MKSCGRGDSALSNLPCRVTLPLMAFSVLVAQATFEIPDLDTIRRWLRRIQEIIVLGGVGLAVGLSMIFIGTWVVSHLRKAKAEPEEGTESAEERPKGWMSLIALGVSFVPVALTLIAAAGMFVPMLRPMMLKMFAYAVAGAGVSWLVSVAALIAGGRREELVRVRRALLLAGTPFYCLAVWLARFLTLGF